MSSTSRPRPTTASWGGTRGCRPARRLRRRRSRAAALDVGCGPGALTASSSRGSAPEAVAAVDPSEPFVRRRARATRASTSGRRRPRSCRSPTTRSTRALAQLVVHFMADPVAGLREMARVTRPGGVVAACVWDHAGERAARRRSGKRRTSSTPNARTSPISQARAQDLARAVPGSGLRRSRRPSSRSRSSTRPSRSGGSRSRSASARPACTPRSLDEEEGSQRCGSGAATCCRNRRSR